MRRARAAARPAASPGGSGGSNPDIDRLVKLVERLASSDRGVTVVTDRSSSSPSSTAVTLLVLLGAGGYAVSRLQGFTLADWMYVTRAGLKSSLAHVTAGEKG